VGKVLVSKLRVGKVKMSHTTGGLSVFILFCFLHTTTICLFGDEI
jgi:hypothetical protein